MKSRLDIFNKYKTYIVLFLCVLTALGIYDLGSKSVELLVDGETMNISTSSYDVKSLIEEMDIEISQEDCVCPGLDEKLSDGMIIKINRAFEVTISEAGESRTVKTAANTVDEFLNQKGIELSERDRVEPEQGSEISAGDEITITRVQVQKLEKIEEVPYSVEVVSDSELDLGKKVVVNKGKPGSKKVTYEVVFENGAEKEKKKIKEEMLSEPVSEVVKKGTKNFLITSRGDTRKFKKAITMSATAYTAGYESTGKTPDHPEYGITRSGTRVRPGVVAVDPRVIPLGSKLYIEPLGIVASAEDTGSAIKGNKIDIYMESLRDARRFGRRTVTVYILK